MHRKEVKMSDITFIDGIDIKKRGDNFYAVSFSEEFIAFYQKYKNDKGYLNTNLCKSKNKDTFYFKLNTWKPKEDDTIVKFKD